MPNWWKSPIGVPGPRNSSTVAWAAWQPSDNQLPDASLFALIPGIVTIRHSLDLPNIFEISSPRPFRCDKLHDRLIATPSRGGAGHLILTKYCDALR